MEADSLNLTTLNDSSSTITPAKDIGVEILTYTIAVFPIVFPIGVILTFYLSLKAYQYRYSSKFTPIMPCYVYAMTWHCIE